MDRRTLLAGGLAALGASSASARPALFSESREVELTIRDGERTVVQYPVSPRSGPAGTGPLFARAGYLHPLQAPNGAVVTDDFPSDHLHQRGVFFAWTKTRVTLEGTALEPDFWNLGSGTGRIRVLKATALNDEGKPTGLQAEHVWEVRKANAWVPVLDETWEVSVTRAFTDAAAPSAAYVLDLTSRQRPRVALELPEYRYGGMCVRGARNWIGLRSAMKVLTSEGKDRAGADGTRARWVAAWGPVPMPAGEVEAGYALLEHPSNPGAPNPLRFPPEFPYAVSCPSKAASLTLAAGKEHVFRYRVLAFNGPAQAEALDRHWKAWAG